MKNQPLAADSSLLTTLIIEETAGIDRTNEPVTVGIPFPKGFLKNTSALSLIDPEDGPLPLQTQVLATWSDQSLKWVLLDFQVSVNAKITRELALTWERLESSSDNQFSISTEEGENRLQIDTGAAEFSVNTKAFKPFESVVVNGNEILNGSKSKTVLTDESGTEYEPLINSVLLETRGPLRTTLKVEGEFRTSNRSSFAAFFSRISFFANQSMIRIEFTILNPRAAKHPGGLWDLGDPGSIFFKDLSLYATLNSSYQLSAIPAPCSDSSTSLGSYQLYEDPIPMDYQQEPNTYQLSAISYQLSGNSHLLIYQDSSGGENWQSRNHVNRYGKVKNSFRGYRIYSDADIIEEGLRANPILSIQGNEKRISGAVQHFWQNFPKALEAKDNTLIARLFPRQYNDVFELQGGEEKTHTVFLDFYLSHRGKPGLEWVQSPLIPRATPEWYAQSKVFNYLIPEIEDTNRQLTGLINTAIKGNNTFFYRREIIDEYGWRNFGEFYADHESVGHTGSKPLVSHYNNQYDCVYGTLVQFVRSGDLRWFILADQLCGHVKDIDIYHTDKDRPEYNHGLFWHTDHYIDAQTATHRCFSKRNRACRGIAAYGGGPSLSHNYSTGLLYHYYMTGSSSSFEALEGLASFVEQNMDIETTLCNQIIKRLKRAKLSSNNLRGKQDLVQPDKVYGLDGPGRVSGNSLNTLIDAYVLTQNDKYLARAEDLISTCINPYDDIRGRDLLDVENRWFYTVFLQALGKYLHVKTEKKQFDHMYQYALQCLIHYAKWMVDNEHLYLEKPEKLEYANETWAAQDIRKCNVLLCASKYSRSDCRQSLLDKARYFYNEVLNCVLKFETKTLTRPVALMMLNGMMYSHWENRAANLIELPHFCSDFEKSEFGNFKWHNFSSLLKSLLILSPKREIQFLKWRIISKQYIRLRSPKRKAIKLNGQEVS